MSITTDREQLAADLEGLGYIVYRAPKENIVVPSLVLVPDSPYVSIKTIGKQLNLSFSLTLCVALNDNEAALRNIEDLMEKTLAVLYLRKGTSIGQFSKPSVTQIGPSDVLTTSIQIEITS